MELREKIDRTQVQLAEALGIKQSSLSKFERGGDPRLSTVRDYVAALGGELHLGATLGGVTFELNFGPSTDKNVDVEFRSEPEPVVGSTLVGIQSGKIHAGPELRVNVPVGGRRGPGEPVGSTGSFAGQIPPKARGSKRRPGASRS